jgi:anti-sigma factor ChrR (cupin superfamily)
VSTRRWVFSNLLASTLPLAFEPFRPGVELARLYQASPEGFSAALLRYAPGARVPRHRHHGFEHIFVLSGSQADEQGLYGAGALIVHAAGTEHSVTSEEGCLVLAIWEQPVEILG